MSRQKNDHDDTFTLGPAGDRTTEEPISLSEITAINPSLLKLIGAQSPTKAVPPPVVPHNYNDDGSSASAATKRNPERIGKQLDITQIKRSKRPIELLTSQEAIEHYRTENLQLRLMVHELKKAKYNYGEKSDTDDDEDDESPTAHQELVATLTKENEELKRELQERDRRKQQVSDKIEWTHNRTVAYKDAGCQTNLDRYNIEELIKASITLKRQKEQQQQQQEQQQQDPPLLQRTSTPRPQRHDKQPQHQVMTQLHYPNVTLPKQLVTSKKLTPDEKEILENMFRLDGIMTTVRDKLIAKSDTR